jgi:hypothetical protein
MPRNVPDAMAIGLSAACMVHCLALPLLLAVLPAWSTWLALPESLHLWLLAIATPLSLAIMVGRRDRAAGQAPLALAVLGLSLMALGLLVEGELAEALVSTCGACLLAAAHVLNWRWRSRSCRT